MSSHDGQEDQHPSEMGIQINPVPPSATSDVEPSTGDDSLDSQMIEPFAPVLEVLQRLEREDPKLAFQASRFVGPYRRLWESCASKHRDVEDLETSNQTLIQTSVHLKKERDGLEARHNQQLSQLHLLTHAQETSRQRLIEVLTLWN